MNEHDDLAHWLEMRPAPLASVLSRLSEAGTSISLLVRQLALVDMDDEAHALTMDPEDEVSPAQRATERADRRFTEALSYCPHVAGWVSTFLERERLSSRHHETGHYLVVVDPIDEPAQFEIGGLVGSSFGILPHPFRGTTPGAAGFLQPARQLVAAGYLLYGASTWLGISTGQGVDLFVLDEARGRWRLLRSGLRIPEKTREFSVDVSWQRHWERPILRYVGECLAGEDGPRRATFNHLWNASKIAGMHRVLQRGGICIDPRTSSPERRFGRLRLLSQVGPMSWLVQQAGGGAVTGVHDALDICPDSLNQRAALIIGSASEVERVQKYYADPEENVSWQLFRQRSVYVGQQN